MRKLSARKLFNRLSGHFKIYFEIFQYKTVVRMGISSTAPKRTEAVKRFIDRTRRKKDAPEVVVREEGKFIKHFASQFQT